MKNLGLMALIVVVVMLLAGIGFGSWWVGRQINYRMLYESLVTDTIHEQVKPECLK